MRYNRIDPNKFVSVLPDPWTLLPTNHEIPDVTDVCAMIENMLYDVLSKACFRVK